MSDETTILLYVLSTLAQTCAALAAFVGAVGLYRLQSLRDERARNESTLRALHEAATGSPEAARRKTIEEIVDLIRADVVGNMPRALAGWAAHPARHRSATRALLAFEMWNLLMIFAALVGFNHVATLAACPWTFRVLWPVAAGTVAVTVYCVLVWTRE
jgi:hypothetical protein